MISYLNSARHLPCPGGAWAYPTEKTRTQNHIDRPPLPLLKHQQPFLLIKPSFIYMHTYPSNIVNMSDMALYDEADAMGGSRYDRFKAWFITSLLHPITEMEAGQVGNCVSVGLWGGIFPIPGATSFIVLVMCWILPVHFSAAMQTVAVATNVLITPVQWGVFPIFIIYGSYFLEDTTCDPVAIISHFTNPKISFVETIQTSSACIGGGCLVWSALGVPFIILISTIIKYIVQCVRLKRNRNRNYSLLEVTGETLESGHERGSSDEDKRSMNQYNNSNRHV